MPVFYAETYEIVTPESAEHGEADERGFTHDPAMPLEADFRELVDMLQGTEPNCSEPQAATWWTVYDDQNPFTGGYESRSYHPDDDRALRYMRRAWALANA
jgi:hypothetical protein